MAVSSIPEAPTQVNSSPLKVLLNVSLTPDQRALLNRVYDQSKACSATELAILVILAENFGKFVSREEMAQRLWGSNWETANNIHQYTSRLRDRLPDWIKIDTQPRTRRKPGGYRLKLAFPRGSVMYMTWQQRRERRKRGLALLAEGKTTSEVARILGVKRELVNKWAFDEKKGRRA